MSYSTSRAPNKPNCSYFPEQDLECPSNLHGKAKYLPLWAKKSIKVEEFPPYLMQNEPEIYEPSEKTDYGSNK